MIGLARRLRRARRRAAARCAARLLTCLRALFPVAHRRAVCVVRGPFEWNRWQVFVPAWSRDRKVIPGVLLNEWDDAPDGLRYALRGAVLRRQNGLRWCAEDPRWADGQEGPLPLPLYRPDWSHKSEYDV